MVVLGLVKTRDCMCIAYVPLKVDFSPWKQSSKTNWKTLPAIVSFIAFSHFSTRVYGLVWSCLWILHFLAGGSHLRMFAVGWTWILAPFRHLERSQKQFALYGSKPVAEIEKASMFLIHCSNRNNSKLAQDAEALLGVIIQCIRNI